MFSYQVYSEQEAMSERFQLLKEGVYDAIISTSQDKISQSSGNPMMDMTITVYDENGKEHDVRDFLVFTKTMMWKVVHCADSAGVMPEYESQKFCSDAVMGKRVRVKVAMEEGSVIPDDKLNGKLPGSKYPNKNKIEDYIKSSEDRDPFSDDDIAF